MHLNRHTQRHTHNMDLVPVRGGLLAPFFFFLIDGLRPGASVLESPPTLTTSVWAYRY